MITEEENMTDKIVKDNDFVGVAKSVKLDSRRRLILPQSLVQDDMIFHIYANSYGQIVLDPQVTIPAAEAWVFQNPEILASIDKGMAESVKGQIVEHGSFAEYVKDAT